MGKTIFSLVMAAAAFAGCAPGQQLPSDGPDIAQGYLGSADVYVTDDPAGIDMPTGHFAAVPEGPDKLSLETPVTLSANTKLTFLVTKWGDHRRTWYSQPQVVVEDGRVVILVEVAEYLGPRTMDHVPSTWHTTVELEGLSAGEYDVFLHTTFVGKLRIQERESNASGQEPRPAATQIRLATRGRHQVR